MIRGEKFHGTPLLAGYWLIPLLLSIVLYFASGVSAWGLQPSLSPDAAPLAAKRVHKQELQINSLHDPLDTAQEHLSPGHLKALEGFKRKHGRAFQVYIDHRSGTASSIIGYVPLIPGSGRDNKLTLAELATQLGEPVTAINAATVAKLSRKFIHDSKDVLNIDIAQLGDVTVTQVDDQLWQVTGAQQVDGIKVRGARLSATISHGNLVIVGTEKWGNVKVNTKAKFDADQALELGFQYADGRRPDDRLLTPPTLEIVPIAPLHLQEGDRYVGPSGEGYEHSLVWTFTFNRPPEVPTWEIMIDAHTGDILSFRDRNRYLTAGITGGVYPFTSTGVCPAPDSCGTMQPNQPMPFADTGLAAPNNFTTAAGLFNYLSGTATTTLSGRFLKIQDMCGTISESAPGSINLGGSNGDHDCVTSGISPGNTAAARSVYYEVNKLQEIARGYLPDNVWLQQQLQANVNIPFNPNIAYSYCNAYWDGQINFVRSSNGCRNTGEIAAIFDHEWAHGLDENDIKGPSCPGESFADIVALYRLQKSCLGYGFFETRNQGCGKTVDGTGYNANESMTGVDHCAENCSGIRDADWDKHTDHRPDTPANFVCSACTADLYGYNGPCGREEHCESAVDRQAAWDFAARDLQSAPFNYDDNTAFLIASRIFYKSSSSIGDWHACSCSGASSNGCGATNAYLQWLAADDDDGDLSNGTPHMTALFNAFNRHGIACSTPAPVNRGCSGAPASAPNVTVMSGNSQVSLSWTALPGSTKYKVFRSEGYDGCSIGKALVATVSGATAFTDAALANGQKYCYSVTAIGSSDACSSPASTCTCATPQVGPQGTLQGLVKDQATSSPIKGVTVSVAGYATLQTDSSGLFQLAGMPVGSYEVSASTYGYQPQSSIPVTISSGTVTPLTINLNPFVMATIHGNVTDGSGHNSWPLYATIAITAPGFSQTVHTDPATGHYSVTLVPGIQHTITVSAPDYLTTTRTITPPAGGSVENFALLIDEATCKAPGYADNYNSYIYSETFESSDGGYTASQASYYPTTWAWGTPVTGPGNAHSGTHVWGTNLSGADGGYEDGYVTSPNIDLSANAGKSSYLSWWHWLSDAYLWDNTLTTVEVSTNGGASWSVIYRPSGVGTSTWTQVSVLLDPAYSVSSFRVRFHWKMSSTPGLYIDDITVAPATCQQVAGGRIVGNIHDATTGTGINDVLVTDNAGHQTISAATPADPSLNDGYYSLFLPAGPTTLTATRTGFGTDTQSLTVVADTVATWNFSLTPAPLTVVQGKVTDGGGHGWPLYAKISITAPNYSQTVYSDPVTGAYSAALYSNTTFTFTVSSLDYTTTVREITTSSAAATEDFVLPVAYCTALGYGDTGSGGLLYYETFEAGEKWVPDDPVWQWIIPSYGPLAAHSGARVWGPMQSAEPYFGTGSVTSPLIDLSANAGQPVSLSWWQWYQVPSTLYKTFVEVSKDGGTTWTNVYHMPADKLAETTWTRHSVQLDASYSVNTFRVRFTYWGATDQSRGWYVDDVAILSNGNCPPLPGGLIVGNVYSAATGTAINSATVTDGEGRTTSTVATGGDTAQDDGFYVIFLPPGDRTLTAISGDTGESKQLQVVAETVRRVNFSLVKDGILQGTVRDTATGIPLGGATVMINRFGTATTDGSGQYLFNKLPVGSYTVTAAKYGYPATSATSVTITSETTTTLDFTLTGSSMATLEGTVTDGSGHGWPLPARIDITAAGYSTTIHTNPITGQYSVPLFLDTPYTITASSPGYNSSTQNFTLSPGVTNRTIILTVDRPACKAPGYSATDSNIVTFEANNGGFTASGTTSWAWGTPSSGPGSGHSGSQVWATNLAGDYGNYEDGYLTSPLMDLSAYSGQSAILVWWQWLTSEANYDFAEVEVSKDGGATWLSIYGPTSGTVDQTWTRHAVSLDPSYSVSTFRVRFHLTSDSYQTAAGWYIDDVSIQPQSSCQPEPGGLVAGNVTAADTGNPLNNALITDLAGHTTYSTATPEIPTVEDGFYSLFLPTGTRTLIASVSDYGGEQALTVAADRITVQNFNLGKCSYTLTPTSAFFTAVGGTGSLTVTTGSGCTWSVTDVPGWITITSGSSGMGSGTVSYAVSANTGTIPRSGSLSIRNQSFAVTQASNYGGLQGYVRSSATGNPISGASVNVSGTSLSTVTNGAGYYSFTTVPVGLHDITVTATAYLPRTITGVNITNDVVTSRDITLDESPLVTVQGTVTDGSGHGWPLYASLTITAAGFNQTVYTNPVTGQYSIVLNKATVYSFTVNSSGYSATVRTVTPPTGGSTENFALAVNLSTCAAPGYTGAFYSQTFESSSGNFTAGGTNSSWAWGIPTSGPYSAHSGSRVWATNLAGVYRQNEVSNITSPAIDLSANTGLSSTLSWWQWLRLGNFNDYASAQVSKDGGQTWVNIFGADNQHNELTWTQHTVVLDPTFSVSNLKLRFSLDNDIYYTSDTEGIYVDDISIGPASCRLLPGGLVIGNISSANTGADLTGATVTDGAGHSATAVATANDPAVAEGYYTLFVPAGSAILTASYPGHVSTIKPVTVVADAVTPLDFIVAKPGTLQGTVTDAATGNPLSGALVTATGGYTGTTNGTGFYQFAGIAPGAYDVTVVRVGYEDQTVAGVMVGSDTTTTQNLPLAATTLVTLQGIVTDGSGHGWPLYAKLDITAPGFAQTIYSNPATGAYSVPLYYGTTYTITANATGYTASTRSIFHPLGGASQNFVLLAGDAPCSAKGYLAAAYQESFDTVNGGYGVSGTSGWVWGTTGAAHSGPGAWATGGVANSYLTSPILDLSGNAGNTTTLTWWEWLELWNNYEHATIEASKDGGASWSIVFDPASPYVKQSWAQRSIVLNAAYSVSNFRIRFHVASGLSYSVWRIDDISLLTQKGCLKLAGGLVVGNVMNANTGSGFNGATVSDGAGQTATAAATPLDPTLEDGFYTMFLPAGSTTLTAASSGYLNDAKTLAVTADAVTLQNFSLIRPGTLQGTVTDAATGNPMIGATVTASGGLSTTTNGSGFYQFAGIRPGSYDITVAAGYHQSQTATGIVVISDVATTQNFALATCSYSITPPSASHAAAGGTGTITVTATAGCGWSVTNVPAWVTITSGGSGAGNGTVGYTVATNSGIAARNGTMTVAGQTFTVNQGSSYGILQGTITSVASGSPVSGATVTASGGYSTTTNASGVYQFAAITAGSHTVTVTAAGYATATANATITSGVTSTQNFALSTCSYSITPPNASHAAAGGTGTITVTTPAGCSWSLANVPAWVTITSGSSGSGNGTVDYSVATNTGTAARTGTMTVAGQIFTVNQGSNFGTLQGTVTSAASGSPISGAAVTASDGLYSDYVTTTNASGFYQFPTFFATTRTVKVTAGGYVSQTTSVVINKDVPTIQNFALTTCSYTLQPVSTSVAGGGGTGTITVTTSAGCGWSVTNVPAWVTITSGSSGAGNGTVGYTVLANTGSNPRTGTITIAGQTFTIDQAAAQYTLNVSRTPFDGGTVSGTGLSCPGGCSATYLSGTSVTLTATVDSGYTFSGWTGCDSFAGNSCTVTLWSGRAVTAAFSPKRDIVYASGYPSLQAAYGTVSATSVLIKAYAADYAENLVFSRDVAVILKGGYAADYMTQSGVATIRGTLTISKGSVEVDGITIAQ